MKLSKFLPTVAVAMMLASPPAVAAPIKWDESHVHSADRLTVSELKTDEYGDYFTVYLEGHTDDPSVLYSNYNFTMEFLDDCGYTFRAVDAENNMDVYLPSEGLADMYPLAPRTNQPYHTAVGMTHNDGVKAIVAVYSIGHYLKAQSGPLLDIYVNKPVESRAADGTATIKFSDICFASLEGENGTGYYPDDHEATLQISSGDVSGIESVDADDTAPEIFYNLQGLRVDNPSHGMYITSRGRKVMIP